MVRTMMSEPAPISPASINPAPISAASIGDFYASFRGQVAAAVISRAIAALWPDCARLDLLGIGYPRPFLAWAPAGPGRRVAAIAGHHPSAAAAGPACVADAEHLPFPDLAFDRILLVHGVEPAGSPERLLREAWRLLRDDGRLLVVAANRTGLWAHTDNNPFGQGQPYSQGQVDRLLGRAMFRAERHRPALFVPPADWPLLLRSHMAWEHAGRALLPGLAGVILTEAVKDAYAGVGATATPAVAALRRRVILPEAA